MPGGPVLRNPPCNVKGAGSIPGWGTKIAGALVRPSPHATATESRSHDKRSRQLQLRPDAAK